LFIDGEPWIYGSPFIIGQAPVPAEFPKWLRMLCKENVGLVIMLTRSEERGIPKADDYFGYTDADTHVRVLSCETQGPFEIRKLVISFDEEYSHSVDHVWYQGWPDFGLLPSADLLLLFHLYDTYASYGQATLTHCSAGLGRAGTFAAALFGYLRFKSPVDRYNRSLELVSYAEEQLSKSGPAVPSSSEQSRALALERAGLVALLRASSQAILSEIIPMCLSVEEVIALINSMRSCRPGLVQNPAQLALCILLLSCPFDWAAKLDELNAHIAHEAHLAAEAAAAAEASAAAADVSPAAAAADVSPAAAVAVVSLAASQPAPDSP